MSGPADIDALVVARRVLANPRTFRTSTNEMLAMSGCLVGLDERIDALEAGPTTNARLAAAIAAAVIAFDRYERQIDDESAEAERHGFEESLQHPQNHI